MRQLVDHCLSGLEMKENDFEFSMGKDRKPQAIAFDNLSQGNVDRMMQCTAKIAKKTWLVYSYVSFYCRSDPKLTDDEQFPKQLL